MSGCLSKKLVVVTGGSGDIGREISLLAATEGARVVATYNRGEGRARNLANEAADRGLPIEVRRLDVSSEAEVRSFFGSVSTEIGNVNALINVAGHSDKAVWFSDLDGLDERRWFEVLKVDLLGSFFCCREAARHMEGGSIVNFSSSAGVTGHTEGLPYSAAKAAVIGLTKSLASILGPKIRVNAIAPGNIDAGSIAWYDEAGRRAMEAEAALKRLGTGREVAEMAVFLASDRASFITGQVILVDGGT